MSIPTFLQVEINDTGGTLEWIVSRSDVKNTASEIWSLPKWQLFHLERPFVSLAPDFHALGSMRVTRSIPFDEDLLGLVNQELPDSLPPRRKTQSVLMQGSCREG